MVLGLFLRVFFILKDIQFHGSIPSPLPSLTHALLVRRATEGLALLLRRATEIEDVRVVTGKCEIEEEPNSPRRIRYCLVVSASSLARTIAASPDLPSSLKALV